MIVKSFGVPVWFPSSNALSVNKFKFLHKFSVCSYTIHHFFPLAYEVRNAKG